MLSRVPQKFSLLITLCALIVSGRMNAATIHVPANSATVQGAVDMANPGDVVSIDNSAVYVESVAVQEAITIMAAAGQTPTLRYDSADATPASYMFYSNVSGAQMGSNLGGQITLDGACDNRVTTFLQSNITSGEVVFENLRCINSTPSAYFIYPDPDPPGDGATGTAVFTFNNIVADGVGCNLSGPTARFDDPDFLIRPDLLSGSTINLNNCTITGADRMCILHGGGDNTSSFGVINIDGSILAGRELAITSEPGDPPRALPITWNVTDSYLESSIDAVEGSIFGGYAAWWIRAAGQVVNATRTVLKENGIGRAFDPWFPGDNGTVTMDHCDIISATNIAITLGPPTLAQPRVVSIRNTNIVAEDSVGFFGVISGNDTFINDYNNVVGGYGGLDMVDPAIKGPNDIDPAILPDYLEPMADSYNFEYTNGTLLTGDEFGGPIGSFRYFGVPPAPTPTPIPSSSVGDWSLYR